MTPTTGTHATPVAALGWVLTRYFDCVSLSYAEEDAAAILAALSDWRLVPADAVSVDGHEPGDSHQYRIACEVCGERGTIRLTVDPETALAPRGPR